MDDELKDLTEQWILAFCEAPPILDARLMRQTLEELAPAALREDQFKP